jgi:cation-transporting ATPase E
VSLAVVGGFPYTPRQSAILALFTVGIPTLALAAWARPGVVPRRGGLIRSLLGFVLPAVITLVPTALGVYLAYFVPAYLTFRHAYPFGGWVAGMEAALPLAQSALTTVTVFCGLLLIPFAEPPVPALAGGDTVSGDWRPTFLTVALLAVFGVVLCVPGLRNLFELAPLRGLDYGVLVGVAVGWAVVLRWVWRTNLVGRFLNAEF